MRLRLTAPLLLACAAFAGCATRTETFNVTVRNDSGQPVTIWLAKIGGPEQEGWRSPESLAINFVVEDEPIGGVVVPPGNTAETGRRKAKLDEDSLAVLRVYKGEMRLSELLANGKDSPHRSDVILSPGKNAFVVTEAKGRIAVSRAGQAAPTAH